MTVPDKAKGSWFQSASKFVEFIFGFIRWEWKQSVWRRKHTDQLLGVPVNRAIDPELGGIRKGVALGPQTFEYSTPFPPGNRNIRVKADRFPLGQQREVYEWLLEKRDVIASIIPELIQRSSDASGHGITTVEQAANAFRPEYIYLIELMEEAPVRWILFYYVGCEQELYGKIEGTAKKIERVSFHM